MLRGSFLAGAALVFFWIPSPVTADDVPLPGGACDGIVDFACTDHYAECDVQGLSCEEVPYRECLVWYVYLDLTGAPEYGSIVCQDDPYYDDH